MFAYLEGKFTYKSPAVVHLDVNGVGYELNVSLNTFSAIQALNSGKLFTHLQVKEDGHTLFGFFDRAEKDIFLLLISVSGIGAATARMVLSSLKADEVRAAVIQGNVKLLESIKGIGKKTAERLVLELKDKMGKVAGSTEELLSMQTNPVEDEAIVALIALGINKTQAEHSVKKIIRFNPEITKLEELIKQALKAI